MDQNSKSIGVQKMESRRGFIKKTSIAAGVTILPASNVWGACNVSGVSGGSQSTTTTCVVHNFDGGRSPGTWSKLVQPHPSSTDIDRIATLWTGLNHNATFPSGGKKTEYYYPRLKAFISSKTLLLGVGSGIPTTSINVSTALLDNRNSLKKHIACSYLNGLFGWNQDLQLEFTGRDGQGLFIEHVWGSAKIGSSRDTKVMLESAYREHCTTTLDHFVSVLGSYAD